MGNSLIRFPVALKIALAMVATAAVMGGFGYFFTPQAVFFVTAALLIPTLAVLRHLGMETLFATIFGGDSLAVHKPDPTPLHAAFAALGAAGLFVGDSEIDAETAQAAAVPFLLFSGG